MGRKIPAKKHRGVKDPLLQQAKRLESLKNKINAPPRDPDEQPVPKSLMRLFGARVTAKPERVRRAGGRTPGAAPRAPGPLRLRRLPAEPGRDFSRRITAAVRALHRADDANTYPEDDEEKPRRPPRRAPRAAAAPRQTRAQRRRLKRTLKNQEIRTNEAPPELVYERVLFGDTAHAPPALPRPRRAVPAAPVGRRQLLLAGATGSAGAAEARRVAVVAAYRALKATRPAR